MVKGLGEEDLILPRMLLINNPMGHDDEIMVPGDMESSYNMVSSIWSVKKKDIVTVTVKVT